MNYGSLNSSQLWFSLSPRSHEQLGRAKYTLDWNAYFEDVFTLLQGTVRIEELLAHHWQANTTATQAVYLGRSDADRSGCISRTDDGR
jgi:hypothetical protein